MRLAGWKSRAMLTARRPARQTNAHATPIGAYPPATVSDCASMLPGLGREGLAAVWTRHCRPTVPNRSKLTCNNFLYGFFQGRTFGTPSAGPVARSTGR